MTLRVTIDGKDREAMADLVRRFEVDVVRTTVRQRAGKGYRVDALLEPERVEELKGAGYAVDVLEDVDKVAEARRADIDWHPDDLPRGTVPRPRRRKG